MLRWIRKVFREVIPGGVRVGGELLCVQSSTVGERKYHHHHGATFGRLISAIPFENIDTMKVIRI